MIHILPVRLLTGPVFAARRQHEYFHGVGERYAIVTRNAYDARGGYAGWQVLGALSKRFPTYWLGGFVRYDSLRGAVFNASPMVASERYLAAGIAISWIVGESTTQIQANDQTIGRTSMLRRVSSLMDNILFGSGARLAHYIRNDPPLRMIKEAVRSLDEGSFLLILPERTRTVSTPLSAPSVEPLEAPVDSLDPPVAYGKRRPYA